MNIITLQKLKKMNKTRKDYENINLDTMFNDHVAINDWKLRDSGYEEKLLTLGFQSYKKHVSLEKFIQYIGMPDYSIMEKESGQICYITPHEKFEGWCWLFDVIKNMVCGFGTNGLNVKFFEGVDGSPKYIHEIMLKVDQATITTKSIHGAVP